MNIYNFGWEEFLKYVPAWNGLTAKARRVFIERIEHQPVYYSRFPEEARALADASFIRFCQDGARVKLSVPLLPFRRAICSMARHSLFKPETDLQALAGYLREIFTHDECTCLVGIIHSYGDVVISLARQICRREWLDRFLSKGSAREWEKDFPGFTRKPVFHSREIFEQAGQILRLLMEGENPMTCDALAAALSPGGALKLAGAIGALVQFGMLFPGLTERDFTPVVGILPEIHRRLHRVKPAPPSAAQTKGERFVSAFLMEDMTAVLVACAGEPLRLRAGSLTIFSAAKKRIVSRLVSMPEWCLRHMDCSIESRMEVGRRTLLMLNFAEVRREKRGGGILTPTAARRDKGVCKTAAGWLCDHKRLVRARPMCCLFNACSLLMSRQGNGVARSGHVRTAAWRDIGHHPGTGRHGETADHPEKITQERRFFTGRRTGPCARFTTDGLTITSIKSFKKNIDILSFI